MSELWIPNMNEKPDVANIFDMMMVFQEQLDWIALEGGGKEEWFTAASCAIRSLAGALKAMSPEARQVRIGTQVAHVRSLEDPLLRLRVEDVGLRGDISDIHCVTLSEDAIPQISLELDVEALFPLAEPEDGDLLMTTGITAINQVHYVEHAA